MTQCPVIMNSSDARLVSFLAEGNGDALALRSASRPVIHRRESIGRPAAAASPCEQRLLDFVLRVGAALLVLASFLIVVRV